MLKTEEHPEVAAVDPLFSMDDESSEQTESDEPIKTDKELEAEAVKKEWLLYREIVTSDPFYQETSSSIKKMLSFKVWKAIKERTPDPDIGDVCLGQVVQRVEIIPGKLVPHFRLISAKEWRYIIDKMTGLIPAQMPNQQAIYRLVFGMYSLGNVPVWSSDVINPDGSVNDDKVERLMRKLEERPVDVLHLLGVHYDWFRARMHMLLEDGQVKNG